MPDFEVEAKYDELIALLEEFLGDHRHHYDSKHQITFDCPNCSALKGVDYDHKGNLEINYAMGVYNCWACSDTHGTKGKLYKLFKDFADPKIVKKFVKGGFVFNSAYYSEEVEKKTSLDLQLPEEYIPLTIANKKYDQLAVAYSYMYGRGISDELMEKYKVGYCFSGKYENRIIIPSYDTNGVLNYFVSRSIRKKDKWKYLNPDVDKTTIIFNEHLIDWEKPVFLVEGAFDHIVIPNSIPLLGKSLYEKLFHALYHNSKNFIIIVLDPDAYQTAVKLLNKLDAGRLYGKVLINKLPENYDVSEFYQKFGESSLNKWLKEKTIRILD